MSDRTDGFSPTKYLSRSWALLTRDKGWVKPVLVLAIAKLVPVAGPLGVRGYEQEWARLTAWGVDSAPKQKDVKVGACIASGWRAFLVALGWSAIYVALTWALGAATERSEFASALVGILSFVLGIALELWLLVSMLRATIYQRVGAGYKASRVWEMMRHDPNGLLRILGIELLGGLLVGAVAIVFLLAVLLMSAPSIMRIAYLTNGMYAYGYGMGSAYLETYVLDQVVSMLAGAAPVVLVGWYACTVVNEVMTLLVTTATGLWFRQFDVPRWGTSDDPLPAGVTGGSGQGNPPEVGLPAVAPAAASDRSEAQQVPSAPVEQAADMTAAPAAEAAGPAEKDVEAAAPRPDAPTEVIDPAPTEAMAPAPATEAAGAAIDPAAAVAQDATAIQGDAARDGVTPSDPDPVPDADAHVDGASDSD